MARHIHATAVDNQAGAFGHALVHIGFDFVKVRLGYQRAHVHIRLGAWAHFHLGDLDLQAGNHCVCRGVTDRHHQRDGHAALAAGTVGRAHQRADRIGHVGIGHDHRMVFCPAQSLHPLAVGAAGGIDVLCNRRATYKADGFDAWVDEQSVHRFFVPVNHIEHARWQAGLQGQLRHQQSAAGIALRRLEHKGVAADHGHGPHPQGHHHREVEGRNARGDAQGLELAPRINRRADVFAVLAFEQFGGVAGVFHVFNTALQLAHGIGQHFAVLSSDQGANFRGMLFEQDLELAHHASAFERGRVAPLGECGLRVGNGLLHRELVGQLQALFDCARGRVEHVGKAGAALGELAADEVADGGKCGHGGSAQSKKIGRTTKHAWGTRWRPQACGKGYA